MRLAMKPNNQHQHHSRLTPTRIDDIRRRTLGAMNLTRTDIDTKGYESLLSLVENTTNDSFDLYYGLFLYNPNATQVRLLEGYYP
jgi:hypothetical protein